MSLDSILSADAIALITNSGKMVFHSVGDTGGANTPTQVDNVAPTWNLTSPATM
jgi:hypothetical protein